MKLLKKLLPVATIASSIACVAPIMTACGSSGVNVAKYEAKFEPAAAYEYDTADELMQAYFKGEKAKEYIVDDILLYVKDMIGSSMPEGASLTANVSVSDINTEKKVISVKISGKASYSATYSGKTYKGSGSINYTLTDIPYLYSSTTTYFSVEKDRSNWIDTTSLSGSYSMSATGEDDDSASASGIKKGTTLTDEAKKVYSVFSTYVRWTSNYFSLATVKSN